MEETIVFCERIKTAPLQEPRIKTKSVLTDKLLYTDLKLRHYKNYSKTFFAEYRFEKTHYY